MELSVNDHGNFAVVHLKGDVDLQTSPQVRKGLLGLLEDGRRPVVDLSAVTYIDSSGIASLVEAYQTARKKGLSFSLVQVSPAAMRVLQLARLDKVFTFHDTVEAATVGA
ncbi:anti-sigma B factor antagonist [Roseospirillum parvum]|uniref:Anti-sigma factor antagonist n=2 Tax=Roseospirillum parvum TaxID=83401 RepID=A0A1G8CIT6_9PROT|nr:anti-sigma B factor antagonist [Roseospirillum parvum]